MERIAKLKDSYKKLKEDFNLLSDEPMKNHTSIKVGGPADLFAMPETNGEFINLITFSSKNNIPLTIIGDGTNLLIKDNGIRGLVISTSKLNQEIKTTKIDSNSFKVTAGVGTKLSTLCKYVMKNNFQGFEFAIGIPGTIGGAVIMNAGTPDGSISKFVDSIKIVTNQGEVKTLKKNDLKFSYRKLNNKGIIIEVSLFFKKGKSIEIKYLFEKNLNYKKTTQPLSSNSAGCIFKNPGSGYPAGKLIDMAGLKGEKIGDAMISNKHANFIVNLGNAKCEDILQLKELIKKKVLNLYSVELQTEIIIKSE
ncbi:MAG: UDP-N-acetylmuramate dehydrogenase [Desulfobacteraceae bacterium]|nr:UDP-N-acetylmuramate dehydrogenase [Desulfobacteraceae bacterium]